MKTLLLSLFLLCYLHASNAQEVLYQKKTTLGSTPAIDLVDMTFDSDDNLYLLGYDRIIKMKEGKVLLEVAINRDDYTEFPGVESRIRASLVVDQQQQIYLLNLVKNQIEKYGKTGQLLKKIPVPQNETYGYIYHWQLYLDKNFNLIAFDPYTREAFVYDREGNYIRKTQLAAPYPHDSSSHVRLAFDADNNIYVAETKMADWNPTQYLTLQNQAGEIITDYSNAIRSSGIKGAHNFEINASGDLYFYKGNSPVYVYSPTGDFKEKFTPVVHAASVYSPYSPGYGYLRFNSQNELYLGIYHTFGSAIYQYDPSHAFVKQHGNLRRPWVVELDKADNLYILDAFTNEVVKVNPEGKELMTFGGVAEGVLYPLAVALDDKFNVYILETRTADCIIRKYDAAGVLVNNFEGIEGASKRIGTNSSKYAGLAIDHLGNMYVSNFHNHTLHKYNASGKLTARFASSGKDKGHLWRPLDVTVDGVGNVLVLDDGGYRVQKFSPSGRLIQQFGASNPSSEHYDLSASIASDAYGNFVTSVGKTIPGYPVEVKLFDLNGKLISSLPKGTPSVTMSRNGNLIVGAAKYNDLITIYETNNSYAYNYITGSVYHDANRNCLQDEEEKGLPDILVKAEPGPYYGATDADGNYKFLVGTGSYSVAPMFDQEKGKTITQTCEVESQPEGINFDGFGDSSAGNNIGTNISLTPYLSVSVSTDRRRRCFAGTTSIRYANTGFAPVPNAQVYLQLPTYVVLKSADKPYTRQADGTYIFDVGNVEAGQKRMITIQDSVICGDESIRGLTVCTKAWITPETPSASIPYATIQVYGACNYENGKIRYVIRNSGQADMAAYEGFRIFSNGALAMTEQYKLSAGDSLVLWVPALGKTLRLEADQSAQHPTSKVAVATVEACTLGPNQTFSTGFVNMLPPAEEGPTRSTSCHEILDSFDPNDKAVIPVGITTAHYTPTDATLRYKIRFQNTGTDVAYNIMVVDTLSEHLDLLTLKVEGASHPYQFEVSGKGRPVLAWTFQDIMLPDSTSNEANSHGFIQFSIKPKAPLAEKTAVENFADIYFDFNAPIRTNLTLNTVYDMPPVITEQNRLDPAEIIATPVITAFTPEAGRPGTEIIITGKHFSETLADNQVWINGQAAPVVSATPNELRIVVPVGASTGILKIQTEDGRTQSHAQFRVYHPPVLTGFSPTEGVIGTRVTLQGNYLSEGDVKSVILGDIRCDIISVSPQAITLLVPEGAKSGVFSVSTQGGDATSKETYMVWHKPSIGSLSKQMDRAGNDLLIEGANFSTVAQRNRVYFGQVPAEILQASATLLKVRVPQEAGSGQITVETPGGTAISAQRFEVIPAPELTAIHPGSGTVGIVVELKGSNFKTLGLQDTVLFNGTKAAILSAEGTSMKVMVPRGTQTGKVQVIGIGGSAISTMDFVVEDIVAQQAIEVYPNPTHGRFTLDFKKANFAVRHVEIYNSIGTSVFSHQFSDEDKLEVNLSALSSGMYLLQVSTARGIVIKKLSIL